MINFVKTYGSLLFLPSKAIAKRLKQLNIDLVIDSDSHQTSISRDAGVETNDKEFRKLLYFAVARRVIFFNLSTMFFVCLTLVMCVQLNNAELVFSTVKLPFIVVVSLTLALLFNSFKHPFYNKFIEREHKRHKKILSIIAREVAENETLNR